MPIRNELQCGASIHNDGSLSPGGSSVVWATHANPSISQPPHCTKGMKWLQPPVNCLPLVTRLKWTADSKLNLLPKTGPRAGGEELKKRFPMLQIRIYDAQTNAREEI